MEKLTKQTNRKLTFIDLCAGIGGFHLGMEQAGFECVGFVEKDRFARMTYQHNHEKKLSLWNATDLLGLQAQQMPDFDIMCCGFPCQPFSRIGSRNGFDDPRGNIFAKLIEITQAKRPAILFLENVAHLYKHDAGNTFAVIQRQLDQLDYQLHHRIIYLSEFGLPQRRPRLYMVALDRRLYAQQDFCWPTYEGKSLTMDDVFAGACNKKIGYTLRVGGRKSGLHDRRNWDTYLVDAKTVHLNEVHAKIMQGFPATFEFPVSQTQAMKQLGNSVSPVIIHHIAQQFHLLQK